MSSGLSPVETKLLEASKKPSRSSESKGASLLLSLAAASARPGSPLKESNGNEESAIASDSHGESNASTLNIKVTPKSEDSHAMVMSVGNSQLLTSPIKVATDDADFSTPKKESIPKRKLDDSAEDDSRTKQKRPESRNSKEDDEKSEGTQRVISPASSNDGSKLDEMHQGTSKRPYYVPPYFPAHYPGYHMFPHGIPAPMYYPYAHPMTRYPPPPHPRAQQYPYPYGHVPQTLYSSVNVALPEKEKRSTRSPSSSPEKKKRKMQMAQMAFPAHNVVSHPFQYARSFPLKLPLPARCWTAADLDVSLPEFTEIVNFPEHMARWNKQRTEEDEKRRCVMCGIERISSHATPPRTKSSTNNKQMTNSQGSNEFTTSEEIIPRQNKGVCTACDVAVWVLREGQKEIKWCKGCKNFRPWAAFGDKGLATKCARCRDRQKEKYAASKRSPHDMLAAKGLSSLRTSPQH